MSFLFGSSGKMKQASTLSPEQQQYLSQLFGGLSGGSAGQGYEQSLQYLMNLLSGDPEAFSAFEAPALRQFNEDIVPGIAERFTNMGAGGGRSSAMPQAFARASESLSEKLASQRAGLQQNAIQQLLGNYMGQGQLGLGTRAFENYYQPGKQGLLGQLAGGLGQGLGMGATGGMGGGWKSLLGGLFG